MKTTRLTIKRPLALTTCGFLVALGAASAMSAGCSDDPIDRAPDAGEPILDADAAAEPTDAGADATDAAPSCGPGETLCGTTCVDTTADNANCGACGKACEGDNAVCASSACSCTPKPLCNGLGDGCGGPVAVGCPASLELDPEGVATATSDLFGNPSTGGAWGPERCPPGHALVGIQGRHEGNIDRYQAVCAALALVEDKTTNPYTYAVEVGAEVALSTFGANGTTAYSIRCPANQVVTRIDGAYEATGVKELSVFCSTLSADGTPGAYAVNASAPTLVSKVASTEDLSAATAFSFACPAGSVIAGTAGRSGAWIDALRWECFAPTLTLSE